MKARILIAAAAAVLAAPLQGMQELQGQQGQQAQHDHGSHPPLHVDGSFRECHVRFAPTLTQDAFGRFVREFGSVSAFRQMAPATTLGKGNVSVGIEVMTFQIDHFSDAWNDTFAHPDAHHELGARQNFPKVKLRVGVTDDIDVGAFFTRNPLSNYGWVGVDGKYRVLSEEASKPVTLALRAAYTKTLYVTDMDMHAVTADVSVERRFGRVFRPYIGLGADGVFARETSSTVNLRNEAVVVPHVLGGFDVSLWRVTIGAEYTVGARSSMQVQVGALVF